MLLQFMHTIVAQTINSGGGGGIRTSEVDRQQIYSLPPLAAWVPLHIRVSYFKVCLVKYQEFFKNFFGVLEK